MSVVKNRLDSVWPYRQQAVKRLRELTCPPLDWTDPVHMGARRLVWDIVPCEAGFRVVGS